ncbi:GMC family oxidoreductase [Yoonia sp. 208BN28-4]|uniref:GMC family oxidoreductase n=1 Tax=Yoonia sp. 208BN28-4 TaxID=3126505 RepID=UPI0030A99570
MASAPAYDFIVIGAGSAGCAVAAGLADAGSVAVVEAGGSDAHPFIKMPFGLIWLMGSKRDWRFKSAPQAALGGRQINIPRGKMLGGSGSINSMVWFRGRADDFDNWQVPGWAWSDVEPAFQEVEARLTPSEMRNPHPMVRKLSRLFGANTPTNPTPERESGGVFRFNMRNGRRWSAADAFLRPAQAKGVTVLTGREVQRLGFDGHTARTVNFTDGTHLTAKRGIVLSAGAIGSPTILLQSGVGPAADLAAQGIALVKDNAGIGANLHDHPGAGLHFTGEGYGIALKQAAAWALSPLNFLFRRNGILSSPTVEGGMFFNAHGTDATPTVQTHFIPFFMNWKGSRYAPGTGFFADVCVCRPKSRGALRLTDQGVSIDFNLLSDPADLDLMVAGIKRLRTLIKEAGINGTEGHPGPDINDDAAIRDYILAHCGTAYHPVGTLRMGQGDAPVTPRLAVRGLQNLWVADASVMPAITSANTNAPSMMIGHRAAQMIRADAA